MKKTIKKILISQPKPSDKKSPYFALAKKRNVQIDFQKFIQLEGVSLNEFRKQNIYPLDFSAIIFTSKVSIDNFFRLCEELRIECPSTMKYFCVAEVTARYLQKYITIRKRKLFIGGGTAKALLKLLGEHPDEKYLYPCGNLHKKDIPNYLDEQGIYYKEGIIYENRPSDLSTLDIESYNLISFFSPSGITALFHNFPKFEQKETVVAAFGPTTAKAAEESGLRVDIKAPKPNMPSMCTAIDKYIEQALEEMI